MKYVRDIFDALGGNSKVAEVTGEKYPTVSSWLVRCHIPPEYWRAIIRYAKANGIKIDADVLIDVAANKKEEKALRAREGEKV